LTIWAVAADLKPGYGDLEGTGVGHLLPDHLEIGGLELQDLGAAEAGDVQMITPGHTLVIVPFAPHVHQVQLIHEAVLLQEREGSIDGHAVDRRLRSLGPAEDLSRIEVVVCGFYDFKNGSSLAGDPNPSRCELRL
jgi:hypothetical protein